tara:strand:- start:443 stop:1213 length:771 start_codon:yes stop_codon:yes gene_type:complete
MSICIHKTGLNKTLGHQSTAGAIVTDDLIGNFKPDTGINDEYWDNQVAGGMNLRRYNSITHNNSTPHNWQFDGSDDYLGEASTGYGGSPFTVDIGAAYTLAQWVKYNNGDHYAFNIGNTLGDEIIALDINDGSAPVNHLATITVMSSTNLVTDATVFTNFSFVDDTWYYIALTHHGDGNYDFYVNGCYIQSSDIGKGSGTYPLEIGKYDSAYTIGSTKVGHVHVYDAALANSQIRQNFLATHEINSDRIYGATYEA